MQSNVHDSWHANCPEISLSDSPLPPQSCKSVAYRERNSVLAPQPMTPEEVRSLVERTRRASERAAQIASDMGGAHTRARWTSGEFRPGARPVRPADPLTLAEMRAAFVDARCTQNSMARLLAPSGICRYCGGAWTRPPSCRNDGHANCMVTPAFRRAVTETWISSAGVTRKVIAETCGVSLWTVNAWTRRTP